MVASEADAYLVEAVQRGDQDAWREVIERYQGRLLSFARRMLAQRSEAEDLVQETFLGLLRSLPNYLFAILRHKLSDHIRKQKPGRRRSLEVLDVQESPQARLSTETPSGHIAGKENIAAQRQALVDCLRQYAEQCRTECRFQELMVVEMLMVLGMRNKEVAADLGLTETAVAGIKFRVLERWRQLTQAAPTAHEWQEADLAAASSVARIWREEGISCPKRSTLGRYLLGTLDEDWNTYIEFHADVAGCDRCLANLDDLRTEDETDAAREKLRERCFASSVGFLSHRPE
jgi:RNA polymerase sigma-70 factor (ECF subfamily)